MMIHEITAVTRRNKKPIRKGRGRSAGHGKTAGRGGKGSTARQGSPHWVPGHEGGQTKLFLRFPKRGFSNADFERRFHIVNLGDLERFDNGTTVDAAALIEAGLIPDEKLPLKVLGDGNFSKKLTVVAAWYSKGAHEKITQAGGAAHNLKGEAFEFPKPKKKFVKRESAPGGGGGKKSKKQQPQGEEASAEGAAPAPAPAPASETAEEPKPE